MLKKFKAVFFDVGGTLLRVHPSVGDVYATHARDFGFTGSADDLNREFRQEWSHMGGMESLGTQKGLEVERAFWKELVRRVFDGGEVAGFLLGRRRGGRHLHRPGPDRIPGPGVAAGEWRPRAGFPYNRRQP